MNPRDLEIRNFSYLLPEEKIAIYPLENRDHSRLLIYRNRQIADDIYSNLADHLPGYSLLVFNNTRVVAARLIFQKPTGGLIEIFALEPGNEYADITEAMRQQGKVYWNCLIGGAGKWKHGQVMRKEIKDDNDSLVLSARIAARSSTSFTIEFSWDPATYSFSEILHKFGSIPIPPYLKRETDASDLERYQTVYAKNDGSVAAPTAGLHFTEEVFKSLKKKNIETAFVTLHVGAGTFMPVKSDTIGGHQMHTEFMQVDKSLLEKLVAHEKDIFAVGTTSLRTLESLYWMGVKCTLNPSITKEELEIQQWEVYEQLADTTITRKAALQALVEWMLTKDLDTLVAKTSILIAPLYRARTVQGIITNFHQPNSTLLLLVAALIGEDWTKVYEHALQNNYRFLSFGDGCLLFV